MMKEISCSFKLAGWDENTVSESVEGQKITKVTVKKEYTGDLEGDGILEYAMFYGRDGVAHYAGYELISGKVLGHSGSFVVEDRGQFSEGVATSHLTILEGSGTGELEGIRGAGSYSLGHADEYPITLNVEMSREDV